MHARLYVCTYVCIIRVHYIRNFTLNIWLTTYVTRVRGNVFCLPQKPPQELTTDANMDFSLYAHESH